MLQRFVSASFVASIGIAFGAVVLWMAKHIWTLQNTHQLALMWCCIPAIWGVWAMLTPRSWMPDRLPVWGAILGLLACANAVFVLNLPQKILGEYVSAFYRAVGVLIAIAVYYLLWMVVRLVYRALRGPEQAEKDFRAAA